MSFVIPAALQIYIFSKNKNVIGHMQEANRTLLAFRRFRKYFAGDQSKRLAGIGEACYEVSRSKKFNKINYV